MPDFYWRLCYLGLNLWSFARIVSKIMLLWRVNFLLIRNIWSKHWGNLFGATVRRSHTQLQGPSGACCHYHLSEVTSSLRLCYKTDHIPIMLWYAGKICGLYDICSNSPAPTSINFFFLSSFPLGPLCWLCPSALLPFPSPYRIFNASLSPFCHLILSDLLWLLSTLPLCLLSHLSITFSFTLQIFTGLEDDWFHPSPTKLITTT